MKATEDKKTYNGWANYETWAVNLWMTNDQGSSNYWDEIAQEVWNDSTPGQYDWQTREQQFTYALADRMKDEHEEGAPDLNSVYADLLSAAMSEVNWYEIAEHYLSVIDKTEDEEQ